MDKMGLRGPKHFTFGDHLYLKNDFHVFLHFHARKHTMLLPETEGI